MVSSDDVPDEFLINWNPSLNSSGTGNRRQSEPTKLCSACDSCRQARVRCGGGSTCQRCSNNDLHCHYSSSRRSGRLKATQVMRRNGHPNRQTPQSLINQQTDLTGNQSCLNREDDDSIPIVQRAKENEFGAFSTPNGQEGFSFDETNDIDACLGSFLSTSAGFPVANTTHRGHSGLNGFGTFVDTSSPISSASPIPSLDFEGDLQFLSGTSPTLKSSSSKTLPWNKPSTAEAAPSRLSPRVDCACLEAQLSSIANLCNPQNDLAGRGLDTVLQATRETSSQISSYLACDRCTKEPTNFVFTVIIFQRLVRLFCDVAKNGALYLASLKLGLGVFELSDEDDTSHKRILITSAVNKLIAILIELGDTTRDYHQTQISEHKTGETMTESSKSNLKWVAVTIQNLQSQLKTIISMVDAHDWGTHRTL